MIRLILALSLLTTPVLAQQQQPPLQAELNSRRIIVEDIMAEFTRAVTSMSSEGEKSRAKIAELEKKITELEKQLADAKASTP